MIERHFRVEMSPRNMILSLKIWRDHPRYQFRWVEYEQRTQKQKVNTCNNLPVIMRFDECHYILPTKSAVYKSDSQRLITKYLHTANHRQNDICILVHGYVHVTESIRKYMLVPRNVTIQVRWTYRDITRHFQQVCLSKKVTFVQLKG